MSAKSKPIEVKIPAAHPAKTEVLGMRKPPSKSVGKIIGTDAGAVPELVRLLMRKQKSFEHDDRMLQIKKMNF